jgi:hypothetical protein
VTGRKDDGGKPRLDLIAPESLMALGAVLGHGAARYGQGTWKAVPDGRDRYYAAALRHLLAWRAGERRDPSSGQPHMAHVMANAMFLLELGRCPPPQAAKEAHEPPEARELKTARPASGWNAQIAAANGGYLERARIQEAAPCG